VATLGLGGVAATNLLPQRTAQAMVGANSQEPRRAKAKSVLVLFLYGAPSQMDTFDPKPDAPAETRGEFKAIPTRIPGVCIAEHLPRIARLLDRVTLAGHVHRFPSRSTKGDASSPR